MSPVFIIFTLVGLSMISYFSIKTMPVWKQPYAKR